MRGDGGERLLGLLGFLDICVVTEGEVQVLLLLIVYIRALIGRRVYL